MTSKPRVTADDPSDISWAELALSMACMVILGLGMIGGLHALSEWGWL
jgi:hypothetical protein